MAQRRPLLKFSRGCNQGVLIWTSGWRRNVSGFNQIIGRMYFLQGLIGSASCWLLAEGCSSPPGLSPCISQGPLEQKYQGGVCVCEDIYSKKLPYTLVTAGKYDLYPHY